MALDLQVDTMPLFRLLLAMIICMIGAGVIVGIVTKSLPNFISRPLIYLAVPAGAYLYFKYILPIIG